MKNKILFKFDKSNISDINFILKHFRYYRDNVQFFN